MNVTTFFLFLPFSLFLLFTSIGCKYSQKPGIVIPTVKSKQAKLELDVKVPVIMECISQIYGCGLIQNETIIRAEDFKACINANKELPPIFVEKLLDSFDSYSDFDDCEINVGKALEEYGKFLDCESAFNKDSNDFDSSDDNDEELIIPKPGTTKSSPFRHQEKIKIENKKPTEFSFQWLLLISAMLLLIVVIITVAVIYFCFRKEKGVVVEANEKMYSLDQKQIPGTESVSSSMYPGFFNSRSQLGTKNSPSHNFKYY